MAQQYNSRTTILSINQSSEEKTALLDGRFLWLNEKGAEGWRLATTAAPFVAGEGTLIIDTIEREIA